MIDSDDLLRAKLESMNAPPAVHCFGHNHNCIGVEATNYQGGKTVSINAAQDELLKIQRDLGLKSSGCAFVFDMLADEEEEDECKETEEAAAAASAAEYTLHL